eukprot:7802600-Pyramimonas_sp.AAC.1
MPRQSAHMDRVEHHRMRCKLWSGTSGRATVWRVGPIPDRFLTDSGILDRFRTDSGPILD